MRTQFPSTPFHYNYACCSLFHLWLCISHVAVFVLRPIYPSIHIMLHCMYNRIYSYIHLKCTSISHPHSMQIILRIYSNVCRITTERSQLIPFQMAKLNMQEHWRITKNPINWLLCAWQNSLPLFLFSTAFAHDVCSILLWCCCRQQYSKNIYKREHNDTN